MEAIMGRLWTNFAKNGGNPNDNSSSTGGEGGRAVVQAASGSAMVAAGGGEEVAEATAVGLVVGLAVFASTVLTNRLCGQSMMQTATST